jgi:peroxiredoxin family protein
MDDTVRPDPALIERMVRERVDAILDERHEAKLAALRESRTPSMTIIATKGTLDWAYPPFILASTAAALGWNVAIFFTFYGLELLKKDLSGLQVSPLGNPAMPMKMPFGPDWFRSIRWNIPNAMQAIVPGFEAFATTMMPWHWKTLTQQSMNLSSESWHCRRERYSGQNCRSISASSKWRVR